MARRTRKSYTPEEREAFAAQREEEVESAVDRIKAGVKSLVTSDDWARYLKVASAFHTYSWRNVMLIMLQRPGSTRVAGFNTWKKVGRMVRKGEKGIRIFAPLHKHFKVTDTATGEETTAKRLYGFKLVSVFDLGQTDGDPLPSVVHTLTGGGSYERTVFDALKAFSAARGVPVSTVNDPSKRANGWFAYPTPVDPKGRITVQERSPAQMTKTLCHEIAHSLMHADQKGCHQYAHNEVEAESVAFVVMHALGIDSGSYSFGYVAGWSDGKAEKVEDVAEAVCKCAKEILADLDKRLP